MLEYSVNNLGWIISAIRSLPDGIYERPSRLLSQATIGQHLRHIIEMYQALMDGYERGTIDYDHRKRDRRIETDIFFAENAIGQIISALPKSDKQLLIISEIEKKEFTLRSNYERELMYNLEHAIHHMALIKVAVLEMTDIQLPAEFGVAPTTLQYRDQCVQ